MENPGILKSILKSSIFKAACVGALLFGGITIAVDYCSSYYDSKTGHGGWGMLLTMILAIPGQVLIEATGIGNSGCFHYLYRTIGGFAIAAIVNGLFGAVIFGGLTWFRTGRRNGIRKD